MPIHSGEDQNGYYYQWGYTHGKKYYYTQGDPVSEDTARKLAVRQSVAAHAHGYSGK